LEDKSHAPHEPARKVTFEDIQEVRRLARNPEIGAYLHSMAYDAVHDAFMALPPYTRIREGEGLSV
jgi:hypothetical protein